MVPKVGVEPTRDCSHRFLRPARLPFRHFGTRGYLWLTGRVKRLFRQLRMTVSHSHDVRVCQYRTADVNGGGYRTIAESADLGVPSGLQSLKPPCDSDLGVRIVPKFVHSGGTDLCWALPVTRCWCQRLRSSRLTVRSSDASLSSGVNDVVQSFARTPLWVTMGWFDFLLQYRRSFLGPLWEVIIVGVWVAGLGLLFGRLLGHERGDYLVYVAAGVVIWQYMSSTLTTGANVFVVNSRQIVSINNPLFTYVLRNVIEHLVKLSVHTLVFIAVLFITRTPPTLGIVLVVPGLAALVLTTLWAIPLLGFIGIRFRDFTHLLRAGMRFLFFATPVFWYADGLNDRAFVANYNPFTHFLEVVRAPLIGGSAPPESWAVVLLINIVGITVMAIMYSRLRRSLTFWI